MLRWAINRDPGMLDLPEGYRAEIVAKGFTYATSIAVKDKDNIKGY